jgi:hypothetical protein
MVDDGLVRNLQEAVLQGSLKATANADPILNFAAHVAVVQAKLTNACVLCMRESRIGVAKQHR